MGAPSGWFVDAALDLLLGGRCAGCARPGRPWCEECRRRACGVPTVVGSLGGPLVGPRAGSGVVVAAGPYAPPLSAAIVHHKERGVQSLADPLGRRLADAVREVLAVGPATPPGGVVVLVPVPSRASAVRERGHDPTARLVDHAARHLRGAGVPARTAALLRLRARVRDQADLDAAERAANLAGALAVDLRAHRALAQACPRACLVLCDDVVTTGATLREGSRALGGVGLPVAGAAVVAAVVDPRRRSGDGPSAGR